ncbi:MAG: CHAD domain-containing protein, partial [Vicinamibacterales bacterium]
NGAGAGRAIEMVRREVASRRQALREELADHAPADLKKLLKKLERVGTAVKAGKRTEGRGKTGKRRTAEVNAEVNKVEAQWRGVLATRLMRRAKSVAIALEHAGPLYVPERIHAVRISTKKLRYVLEIARDAGVTAAMPIIRILKRHQERLGHLHDLQILLRHVRETQALPGVGSRGNELAAYADSLDRECRRLHAGYVEHRAELASAVKDVRHHVVPALTTPPRRQARVAATPAVSVRPRRAK